MRDEQDIRVKLRGALVALNVLKGAFEGPCRQALAAENAFDELATHFDTLFVAVCEGCGVPLLEGDLGHRCYDGEPVFCAACTYTWAEVYAQYAEGEHSGDADERGYFMRRFDRHVAAGGNADDKMVWRL